MKQVYFRPGKIFRGIILTAIMAIGLRSYSQTPTIVTVGFCDGVVANFNTNDNGFNSPSVYGSIFDSSFYYNATRGYWTDYMPPLRVNAPGAPRVMDIISPPYVNPNPAGTFNVGFYYICPDPVLDRFQVRIISVRETSAGTVTDVEATSGTQSFSAWSTPTPYVDVTMGAAPTTPFMNGVQGNVCIRLIDPDIQNTPNTTYRVEVAYQINEPGFAVFDDLSIGPSNIPLPVNFIGLVADRDNSANLVNLRWDVSEEINVKEYQVEKSLNGSSFSSVGSVLAKGKSIYAYTNMNAGEGTLYYRVKSVDMDGHFKYSGILRLAGGASNSYGGGMQVYPNPMHDQAIVEHKQLAAKAQITISTIDGKILKVIIPSPGTSHTQVNLVGIAPGMYFMKLDDGMGFIETTRFVKQ
jgi:hypothetical protein